VTAAPGTVGTAGTIAAGGWQRLHPLSFLVRLGRAVVPLVAVLVIPQYGDERTNLIIHLVTIAVLALAGVVSWVVTRWRVEDGTLRVESGLLKRESQRLPLSRVQAIDIIRPGLARVLGLAEVRLRTAGQEGDAGRLAYLRVDEAERVRARLLALAHGVHPDAPPPPEVPLYAQRTGRLTAAVALSRPFAVLAAVAVGVGITALFSPRVAVGLVTTWIAYVLAVATLVWRRFNGGYGLQVGEAADGLRLRSGALETTAETIPRGRVQALVLTEPLALRPWGLVRLQVDVAGHAKNREERQSDTRQLRAVVPAGDPADAERLLDRLLADRPVRPVPPPVRARWKSPLRYHWLGVDWNAGAVAVHGGRVTRRTVWVPLAKVQSLRLVQGPVQRRLRLATIHVDAAGRRVTASIRDRDVAEAERLLGELAEACRRARVPVAPRPPEPAAQAVAEPAAQPAEPTGAAQ
jgi:putative membrane protein